MVTMPLPFSCTGVVVAHVNQRPIAPPISRQINAATASTIEGGRDARTDFGPQMCESKIKGPTRRSVESVSAHGVAWHALQIARAAGRENSNPIRRNQSAAYARLRSSTLRLRDG